MTLKMLNLETIKDLDLGRVGVAFQRLLEQAVRDCLDRPGDNRARKLVMQMSIVPVAQTIGNTISCEGAKGVVQLRLKQPDHESQQVDFGVRENGRLVFSEESPSNHRQGTLAFDSEAEGDEE